MDCFKIKKAFFVLSLPDDAELKHMGPRLIELTVQAVVGFSLSFVGV